MGAYNGCSQRNVMESRHHKICYSRCSKHTLKKTVLNWRKLVWAYLSFPGKSIPIVQCMVYSEIIHTSNIEREYSIMINKNTGYEFEGDHGGVYGKGRFKGRKRGKGKEKCCHYIIFSKTHISLRKCRNLWLIYRRKHCQKKKILLIKRLEFETKNF